jgi:ATP-dependent Clp protease adaptor protein ClpS
MLTTFGWGKRGYMGNSRHVGAIGSPIGTACVRRPRAGQGMGDACTAARRPTVEGVSVAPVELEQPAVREAAAPDVPWITLVWNDPVNTMTYVTWVFQAYFGYPEAKAQRLMLDVHHKGRAVVSTGSREEMERDTEAMHEYGLWATFRKDE